jgi:hypothetical protein
LSISWANFLVSSVYGNSMTRWIDFVRGIQFDGEDVWKHVLYVKSLLIDVSAVLNEGVSASWMREELYCLVCKPKPVKDENQSCTKYISKEEVWDTQT